MDSADQSWTGSNRARNTQVEKDQKKTRVVLIVQNPALVEVTEEQSAPSAGYCVS